MEKAHFSLKKLLQTEQVLVLTGLFEFVQLLQKLQAVHPLFHTNVRDMPAEGSTHPVYKQSFTRNYFFGNSDCISWIWGLGCLKLHGSSE